MYFTNGLNWNDCHGKADSLFILNFGDKTGLFYRGDFKSIYKGISIYYEHNWSRIVKGKVFARNFPRNDVI